MTSRIIGANVIQTGCCGWPVCGAVAWAKIPFKSIKCINSKVVGHFRQINGNGKRFGMCALESAGFGECETDWREEIKLRPDLTQRRKDAATGARTALSARRRQCGRNTRTKLSAPLKSLAAHVDSDVLRCEVAKTSFASLQCYLMTSFLSEKIFHHGWTRIHTDGKEGSTTLDTNCANYR